MLIRILTISVLLVIVAFVSVVLLVGPPSGRVMDNLRIEGNEMVEQVDQFKRSEGRYPQSLSAIGADCGTAKYGGWKYGIENGGESYFLQIGEYEDDLFTLIWASDEREWYLDR